MATGDEEFLPIKSNNPTTTWSREVTLQIEKGFISSTTAPIVKTLDRVMIYLEGSPLIKLLEPLFKWSCEIL